MIRMADLLLEIINNLFRKININPDSKIAADQIWPTPDSFIWPTYRVEWRHPGKPCYGLLCLWIQCFTSNVKREKDWRIRTSHCNAVLGYFGWSCNVLM